VGRVDWILGQALFWLMVVLIIAVGLVGVRRSGAQLAAHQAGLVAGRSAGGEAAGLRQAGRDLSAWWGIDARDAGRVTQIESDPLRRSIRVIVEGVSRTLLGHEATLGAGSFQRVEGFYPGPPEEEGWE
jgi:hypothetical protein